MGSFKGYLGTLRAGSEMWLQGAWGGLWPVVGALAFVEGLLSLPCRLPHALWGGWVPAQCPWLESDLVVVLDRCGKVPAGAPHALTRCVGG